jgi:hypothetical protein
LDEEENTPTRRSYSDAEAAADLAAFYTLKRSVSIRTLFFVALAGLACVRWLPVPALAIVVGGICGVANTWLMVRHGERLVDRGGIGRFVLSSFLRIGTFGIVPVAFAARGPWWSFAWYFAGFFLPLAMFAYGAPRVFAAK